MANSKGADLVRHALEEDDDDDPRADCNRLRDPFAFDTNPFGPKANYIVEREARLSDEPKIETARS